MVNYKDIDMAKLLKEHLLQEYQKHQRTYESFKKTSEAKIQQAIKIAKSSHNTPMTTEEITNLEK